MKSKIEQICEDFEQANSDSEVDLSSYHPMNIASVIKLYLRKLPEPLLTHELYDEWIAFAEVIGNFNIYLNYYFSFLSSSLLINLICLKIFFFCDTKRKWRTVLTLKITVLIVRKEGKKSLILIILTVINLVLFKYLKRKLNFKKFF